HRRGARRRRGGDRGDPPPPRCHPRHAPGPPRPHRPAPGPTTVSTQTNGRTIALAEGRRADTTRRRQRVLVALAEAAAGGSEITVSGIARRAGVDRTFLYRHRDLLEQLHQLDIELPSSTSASFKSDLHAAQHRAARLAARVQHLERRLSELLGEQTWHDSGLGAPDDID